MGTKLPRFLLPLPPDTPPLRYAHLRGTLQYP